MGKYATSVLETSRIDAAAVELAYKAANRRRMVLDGPFIESKELLLGYQGQPGVGRYAWINGLRMYYEIHGHGRPLVLLHAALTTIDGSFGKVVRALASTRRVIAIEQQAHGRTHDIDRPLSYAQMADDTAELLRQLELERVDVFGYSMGGSIALELVVRHPELVRRLTVVSSSFEPDGYTDRAIDRVMSMDAFDPSWAGEPQQDFARVGAAPENWPAAVRRTKEAIGTHRGLSRSELRRIRAPTLIISGDRGLVRLDHAVEMSQLLPGSQLRVIPTDDHHPTMVRRSAALIPAFLDSPA